MSQIPNKKVAEIADITEKTWFTCYSIPQQIVFDRSTKFMDEIFQDVSKQIWPIKETKNNQKLSVQYKVGDKILVKLKKKYKHELEFIGPIPITKKK